MNNISDLAALLKASNLAEIQYTLNPTPENKAKFQEANKAYRDASRLPVKKEAEIVEQPKQEYSIVEEENGCVWIVRLDDKACFASQTALAWMCEVSQPVISAIVGRDSKCPKALLELDFDGIAKIKIPNNPTELVGIPANLCSEILFYYAFEARGHEKRTRAKALGRAMISAGATAFIAKKAGYQFALTQNQMAEEILQLKREFAEMKKHFLQGDFSNEGRNQYGETPREAYFRKRENWRDMYNWMRNWGKNRE